MSTGLVIAIIVVAILIVAVALWALPRMRGRAAARRVDDRRTEAADLHRGEAEQQRLRAQSAEQEAQRARAEAGLHESRADMHERGMADDDLAAQDERFDRDRERAGERAAPNVEREPHE
jgi:Flp pilus assembly protein TadB